MQLNREQATAILTLLEGMPLRQIRAAGALSALAVLESIGADGLVGIYLIVSENGSEAITAIKTIREHTGVGLKEAKNMFDTMFAAATPNLDGSVEIGPIKRVPLIEAQAIQASSHRDLAPIFWQ